MLPLLGGDVDKPPTASHHPMLPCYLPVVVVVIAGVSFKASLRQSTLTNTSNPLFGAVPDITAAITPTSAPPSHHSMPDSPPPPPKPHHQPPLRVIHPENKKNGKKEQHQKHSSNNNITQLLENQQPFLGFSLLHKVKFILYSHYLGDAMGLRSISGAANVLVLALLDLPGLLFFSAYTSFVLFRA